MRRLVQIAGLYLLAAFPPGAGLAGEPEDGGGMRPKWEIGLAGGAGWQHHYPGAEQGGGAAVAFPYLVYRSERLRLGQGGLISGRFLKNERLEFTASIGGSLPSHSKDNRAREGMPDLGTLFEIGPQLVVTLGGEPGVDKWSLRLPLRAVLSTDFSRVDYRGLLFQPRLAYRRENLGGSDLAATISAGPIFAGEQLMDFFYGVPAAYATPDRPAYEAQGGYMGTDLSLGLSYRPTPRWRFFIGGEATFLEGATNTESPLLRQRINYSLGLGVTWRLLASKTMVAD